MLSPSDLFDLDGMTHASLFDGVDNVWEALDKIKDFTRSLFSEAGGNGAMLRQGGDLLGGTVVIHDGRVHDSGFEILGGDPTKGQMLVRIAGQETADAVVVYAGAAIMDDEVHLSPGCKVEPGALIKGPSFIGPNSEVRQGAYLRGSCLVGKGCVVGHTTEMKNAAMLDGAKAGHFAYLGDSILGREVNLGAGTKLANLKIIEHPYRMKLGGDGRGCRSAQIRGHHRRPHPNRVQQRDQPGNHFGQGLPGGPLCLGALGSVQVKERDPLN